MPKKSPALPAKLSPPRLVQALPRERLFSWLDGQRERSAVWVAGAPGAGKTMLVASYCQARALRMLWYRFDADDNDIGRCFATLGQAVDALGIRARRPAFAAEHLGQPMVYARAWFRLVFAALPRPIVLVLDNLEQAALPALPALLACAIDELPQGVLLLMTSRHAPPPELAGALVSGAIAALPAADLDFDTGETAAYARALGLDAEHVAAASRRVRGWAAGLRLLSHAGDSISGAKTSGGKPNSEKPGAKPAANPGAQPGDDPSPRLLFDYFAGLLHESLSAQGQHLMLVSALLPWVPADLVAHLAGVEHAREQLEKLCADNLFTERVEHSADVYRLHPMLRECLLERGRQMLAPAQRQGLLCDAARAFLSRGESDVALDLFLDAGDLSAASELLLAVFEAKLALGQLDQLQAWAARLPAARLDQQPWLHYAMARLCFLREDSAAPVHYESAARAFQAQGDLQGQRLCAAGVLEWSYNSDNFVGHERWSALLRDAAPAGGEGAAEAPSELHALRLLNGRLLACFFDGDFDREGERWIDEVLNLLVPGGAENEKLSAAITLLGCLERHKRWDAALLLAGKMEALVESPGVGPRLKILALQQIAVDLHRQTGAYDSARRLALAARAQSREHGFHVLEFEAVAVLLFAALYTGDDTEARVLLADLARLIDPASVYHQRFASQMRGWQALQAGHLAVAREHADALRAAVARSDMPAHFRATWLQLPIYVGVAEGHVDEACAELAAMCADAEPGSRQVLEANLHSLRAWSALVAGDDDAAATLLARAWEAAAATRYYQLIAPLRDVLAQLAEFALKRGVATGFAAELIHRRRLHAPSVAALHWPWRLRIRTLGRFDIMVDGEPLAFDGKVPRKPLALLKALIACGANAVPEHLLSDALWPDDDADAAHDAFNVALHRLRKLLPGGTELIRLQDGRLSLDSRAVWLDCQAFEHLANQAGSAIDVRRVSLEPLRRAFGLYQGHFLADEDHSAWSVSARERLRAKFGQVVIAYGQALGEAGRDDEAMACYRRGLDTDDLNEAFYQGVMRCALRLQRPAEGLAAYQRLKRMLSLLLGVMPSPASEALRRSLLGP